METLTQLSESLQRGETENVAELTDRAIAEGLAPQTILDDGLIAAMAVIGEKFRVHEIFLPDVLLAARAMYAGMDKLKPLLIKEGVPTIGKVVMGSVQGDLHDIGKNIVSIMLKGAGFEVVDLGNDVSPEKFIESADREGARIIGLSALLTTTMPVMKKVVDLVKESGMSDRLKVIIGGAPVSADYAREIGADAYCFDGMSAVDCVKKHLGVGRHD
ncbi:MAG: corrinoid protein [candidate division Zixibacteria bacterium]|nr:corrinoid protein [candidate division Zixibacteria bacterium]MBU1470689.1 corrinoid protein [candidate division Zixibacteria bacterium]MBU2625005.1 corrinoid protein [candidate division Zixibacteria bacterium]